MNLLEIFSYCIVIGMFLLVFIIAIKLIRNRVAKSVEISATVIDKRKSDYTKYTPVPEQTTDYILVFQSKNKKLSLAFLIFYGVKQNKNSIRSFYSFLKILIFIIF